MSRYSTNDELLAKFREVADKEEPIELYIRDNEELSTKYVRALLSRTPIEGGETLSFASFGVMGVKGEEEWYIKILEDLEEDGMVYTPTENIMY